MQKNEYEDYKEELEALRNEVITIDKEEVSKLDAVIKKVMACKNIKCLEKINHSLTNIHMLTIFVKIINNKIIHFKAQIQQQKLELEQFQSEINKYEK